MKVYLLKEVWCNGYEESSSVYKIFFSEASAQHIAAVKREQNLSCDLEWEVEEWDIE